MIFSKYLVQNKSQNRFLNYTFGHWSLFPQRNGALLANRVLYINRNTNSNSSIVAPSGNHPALTPCEYFISESAFFIMTHFTRLQEISPWAYSSNFQLFLCSLHKRQNHCTSAMLLPSMCTVPLALLLAQHVVLRRRKRISSAPWSGGGVDWYLFSRSAAYRYTR